MERQWKMSWWRWTWLYWLARLRLSQHAICVMSADRGCDDDFHDYPDTVDGEPFHFVTMKCRHCGKEFTL